MPYQQLLKYMIVGVVSTSIHFTIASLFVFFIYASLLFSNIAGFIMAFTWSYWAQSKFVFYSRFSSKKSARFFLVQALALVLSVNITDLALNHSIYLKIFVVTLLLPICSFVIHKFWTFREDKKKA